MAIPAVACVTTTALPCPEHQAPEPQYSLITGWLHMPIWLQHGLSLCSLLGHVQSLWHDVSLDHRSIAHCIICNLAACLWALGHLLAALAGRKELSEAQNAKLSKLSERAGNPVFSPSRLLAAVCKVAPQFKVCTICI